MRCVSKTVQKIGFLPFAREIGIFFRAEKGPGEAMIIMIISFFKILGDFFSFFACVFVRFFLLLKKSKLSKIVQNWKERINAQSALFTIISYVKNQYIAISQIFLWVFSSKISTLQFCEFFRQKSEHCNFPDFFYEFFFGNWRDY